MGETITIRTGAATEVIKVIEQGPQGPVGPKGDPGDVAGLPLTTTGDTLYRANSTTNARLPIGAAGQILKVSSQGLPHWAAEEGGVSSWNDLTDKPSTFAPSAHTHPISDVTNLQTALDSKAASSHTHTASQVTDFNTAAAAAAPVQSVAGRTGAVTLAVADVANAVSTSDSRLTDSRQPTLHGSTHHTGGTDAIAPSSIGAAASGAVTASGLTVSNTSRILGRHSTGSGAVQELQLSSPLSLNQSTGFLGILSGAYASPTHTHGNLTNAGAIGTTANLPLKTGTNGVIEAGSFSNTAGSFCEGNDARLSDDRDPNLHAASHLPEGADEIFDQSLNTTDSVEFNALKIYTAASPTVDKQVLVADDEGNILSITGNEADARASLGLGDAAVEDTTAFAASGSITSSGLTQATARILGRTTASTGSIEEIQIGAGLSLSAGELSAAGAGVTAVGASTADVLSVSGSDLVADDPNADRIVFWDDSESKLRYLEAGSGLTISGTTMTASGGVSAVDATTADVFSVSGSNLVADDGGLINSANPAVVWDDVAGKLVYANPLARPSGAGSMFVGLAPSTTALGTDAVNIQTTRTAATTVASGVRAICVGNSTASGQESISIGRASLASSTHAICIGDQSSATAQAAVCIGRETSASGSLGVVGIGYAANASSANSVAFSLVTTSLRSQFGTIPFNAVYWGGQTTNATATILNLDATATNRMTIAANTALAVDILLVARRSDTADKWLVARRFLGIRRDGSNNTSLIGSVQTLGTDQSAGSPSWTFALTADDTNEALQLEVTGAASETVQWRATAFYRVA
jgi:hypothetical protein